MSDNEWIYLIPSIVFSRIKAEFPESLIASMHLTDENFSTVSSNNSKAVFPFVYVNMLPPVEQGKDLEGLAINAGLFSFQVDVTAKTQRDAKNVMIQVTNAMKKMRFDVVAMPVFEALENTHRSSARFRRMIGASDTL